MIPSTSKEKYRIQCFLKDTTQLIGKRIIVFLQEQRKVCKLSCCFFRFTKTFTIKIRTLGGLCPFLKSEFSGIASILQTKTRTFQFVMGSQLTYVILLSSVYCITFDFSAIQNYQSVASVAAVLVSRPIEPPFEGHTVIITRSFALHFRWLNFNPIVASSSRSSITGKFKSKNNGIKNVERFTILRIILVQGPC